MRGRITVAAAALALPATAAAHGFGRLYNLPVPFWLYAWGAAGTLVLSFLLVGYFASAPASAPSFRVRELGGGVRRALRRLAPALQVLGVFLLLLCIATGLFGNRDPLRNFSMTFFWVVFVLGFAYVTAFAGDFYARLNPWRTLAEILDRVVRGYVRGRWRYPERLGDWPALALYLAFVWFELFGHGKPAPLGSMLLAYTALNFAGVWLFGSVAWFRHCEFFSVFLRLVALMAPLDYRRAEGGAHGTLRWRAPFAGLVQERPAHISTVVFALAMLSTTAFDGLRATQWWVSLFWRDPTGIVTVLAGERPLLVFPRLLPWYLGWETFWLLASPFLYFGAYLLFVALGKFMARSARSVSELALDFGYTLLPIALAYSVTHYATLILTQGLKIVSLASDPFGWGWNLFGTATLLRAPILPEMGLVWHMQVVLILLGHVVSVYVAHLVALKTFATRRQALLSQLPQLCLMVAFTVSGLWILAQPLTAEMLR
ncbi:MAG: hypothetical protein HYV18_06630 [Gammaproteobacteria bacterium]|nr:hypothetical protein [Gammaproteobacteria bacterium]